MKKRLTVVLIVAGLAVILAASASVFFPHFAATIAIVATIVAAGGTIVTVTLSADAAHQADNAAQSAKEAAEATLLAQASVELPALKAQRELWVLDKNSQELHDRMHLAYAAEKRIDQATARIHELLRILKMKAPPEDDGHSIWDDVPGN